MNPDHTIPSCAPCATRGARPPGFTIVELLVVVVVVAALLAVLLPALAGARDVARSTGCLANLRQIAMLLRTYANENAGVGPALGQPYDRPPNWALVVLRDSGREARTATTLYTTAESVLVCPSAQARAGGALTRTYAANATGLAGAPGDRANFDSLTPPAHAFFDRVASPVRTPMAVDSAAAPVSGPAPPPTRTSSVIDFRNPLHVPARLGLVHADARRLQAAMFDASARPATLEDATSTVWRTRLP